CSEMTEPVVHKLPVRVLPLTKKNIFSWPNSDSSKTNDAALTINTHSRSTKTRGPKIEVDSRFNDAFLGADSATFSDEALEKSNGSKGRKKKKRSIIGAIKNFASKKSKSFDSMIDEESESDYDRAVRLAESSLHTLRNIRFPVGEIYDRWSGSRFEEQLRNLHKMEPKGSVTEKETDWGTFSLAQCLRLEIDTVKEKRKQFKEEVLDICHLIDSMESAVESIPSTLFHTLFSSIHHIHSSVKFDEVWAALIVGACKVLHDYSELRRIVVLIVEMTRTKTADMEPETEMIRCLLLHETVGDCTEWEMLSECQRDVICCILMRRKSTVESIASLSHSSTSCLEMDQLTSTLNRSTITKKEDESSPDSLTTHEVSYIQLDYNGKMCHGAEASLREAGIEGEKLEEKMMNAAKDLGSRLDDEFARPLHNKTRCISFPGILSSN
ncbi:hypothetical protein PFISCL1PPCAC_1708, partial [Pristionchus fissidentatus]